MPNKITLNSEQTPSFHDVTFSLTSRKRRTKTHYASTILKFIHWWEAAKLWELQPPVTMTQWLVSWQRARRAKVRSAEVRGGTRAPPQHWCRKQKPGVCCWYKPAPLWLLKLLTSGLRRSHWVSSFCFDFQIPRLNLRTVSRRCDLQTRKICLNQRSVQNGD